MRPLANSLQDEYGALSGAPPPWAYRLPTTKHLPATIPFVGDNYHRASPRIAVYASAENLAHYERRPETVPAFLLDQRAKDRHRAAFEDAKAARSGTFWPSVHIGPVENGSLLCATLFVRGKLDGERCPITSPPSLVEELLLGNVGKYSKRGERNRDYIGSINHLRPSLPFLRVDLRVAQPDVVLFPKSALRHREVWQVLAQETPSALVLPIPQFNATVVNTHLKGFHGRAQELRRELAETTLGTWVEMLSGYAPGYAYRYLAMIERLLEEPSSR